MNEHPKTEYPSEADVRMLEAAVAKANAGDQRALSWLRDFLDENPQVWRHAGNLARVAEQAWIDLISNGDKLAEESIQRQLHEMQKALRGEEAGLLETLLCDQVVATWLEMKYREATAADPEGTSVGQANLMLKRLESAQRRHLAAIKSLTQTRQLLREQSRPAFQVVGRRTAG